MGKRRWTTAEQLTWLENLIPGFIQAQQGKVVGSFLTDVYGKWEKKWPTLPPTKEEVKRVKGDRGRALALKQKGAEDVRSSHNKDISH